ncbi:MAG: acyl-CoA dehydrogenase family protein [Haloferacaceae archaeon]
MRFTLTEAQRELKQTAADLAAAEFADRAFTWAGELPVENRETLAENGLLGLALPERYGGGGGTVVDVLLAQEAVGRVCPDTAHVLSRSSMGPPRVIAELGSEALKERYLPPVCAGETTMSVAISEPGAGSDAGAMTTTARVDGGAVTVDGQKTWVGKAEESGAFLVWARFDDGDIGAVVVDADAPGFSLGTEHTNMAGHAQHELRFDGCELPREQVLAHGDESFVALLTEFNVERCHNAMMCVACGLRAFDEAMTYAREREQFGQQISEFQGIEWKLADVATRLEAARLMVYRAADNAVRSSPSRLETSMAKVLANEAGQHAVDEALQICGARGYMQSHPVEYLYRWVRGWKIAGGTVEVQRNGIARELKKHGLD